MARLSINNVTKHYGQIDILKGIDIQLEDGEFLVLLGPSGCGKSTLLSIIAGLTDPSSGEIRIGARLVNDVHPKDRDIAMVFQSYALYPNMNVAKNMEFGLEMRGVGRAEREAAIAKVAKLLQIEHLLSRRPADLSGGQRQRIAIMKDGLVQQFATPAEIYDRPTNMYAAGFIGAPAMNFVRGHIAQEDGQLGISALVKAHGTQGPSFLPLADVQPNVRDWVGRDVVLGVRPEAISVSGTPDRQPATAQVDAEIDVIEPTRADTLAYFTMGGATTVARLRPQDIAGAGGTLRFTLDMTRTSLFDPMTEVRLN